MKTRTMLSVTLLIISLAAATAAAAQTSHQHRNGLSNVLNSLGLPDARPAHVIAAPQSVNPATDPVALGLAGSKSYAFTTADYPGASYSLVLDTNLTTAVGAFAYDGSTLQAFTLKGTTYKTLAVPGSTQSYAQGINTAGQIVGVYIDALGTTHGFFDNAGAFATIDYPGSVVTWAVDINDAGQIVGRYVDSALHGYLYQSGVFTAINFPGSIGTSAQGINSNGDIVGYWNDTGVIAGLYLDASGLQHGFTYSGGAFTRVDVVGASGSLLTRVKNNKTVTGGFVDVLTELHGIKGH